MRFLNHGKYREIGEYIRKNTMNASKEFCLKRMAD